MGGRLSTSRASTSFCHMDFIMKEKMSTCKRIVNMQLKYQGMTQ
jgi:hypothetical protein